MKIKMSSKGEKWRCSEDDITRHSLIHALIQLADRLVIDALEDDEVRERLASPEKADDFGAAILGKDAEDMFEGSEPIALRAWEFDPTGEDRDAGHARVILGGFPSGGTFFLILSTDSFETSAQLMYEYDVEIDCHDLVGGYVPFFKGDPMKALHWVQEIGLDLLDELDETESSAAERPAG